jgi:hypothetical protein
MTTSRDNLDRLLRAVAVGPADDLSPEELARFEQVLNTDAAIAARVAGERPERDPVLRPALAALEQLEQPSVAAWEQTWARIAAAEPVVLRMPRATWMRHVQRYWRPLAAVAAVLCLAVLWQYDAPAATDPWPLQLATNARIDELEVSEGESSFVISIGSDGGEVIWILPDRTL